MLVPKPDMQMLLPALITTAASNPSLDANVLVTYSKLCFDRVGQVPRALTGSALFLAMERFLWGVTTIQLLLKHGRAVDSEKSYQVRKHGEPELVPAPLWALCQPSRKISDAVIVSFW